MSIIPNALQVRAMAEAASGYRDQTICFYDAGDGTIGIWPESRGPCPHDVILTCRTNDVNPDRVPVSQATLGIKDRPPVDLLKIPYRGTTVAADAVFWSEGAVEKFAFPYYASKGGWQADLYTAALRRVFYGRRPLSTFEQVEEHPEDFMDADEKFVPDSGDADALAGMEPFGLVHIPKSDYIEQDPGLQSQTVRTTGSLGVLLRHRVEDGVRLMMLKDLIGPGTPAPAAAPAAPAAPAPESRPAGAGAGVKSPRKAGSRSTKGRKAGRAAM